MQAVRVLGRRVAANNGFAVGHCNISTAKPALAGQSGAREAQLLEKDPALSKYHAAKDTVSAIKRFGDVLVILVAAGAVFEIGYRVQHRNAAHSEESRDTVAASATTE